MKLFYFKLKSFLFKIKCLGYEIKSFYFYSYLYYFLFKLVGEPSRTTYFLKAITKLQSNIKPRHRASSPAHLLSHQRFNSNFQLPTIQCSLISTPPNGHRSINFKNLFQADQSTIRISVICPTVKNQTTPKCNQCITPSYHQAPYYSIQTLLPLIPSSAPPILSPNNFWNFRPPTDPCPSSDSESLHGQFAIIKPYWRLL